MESLKFKFTNILPLLIFSFFLFCIVLPVYAEEEVSTDEVLVPEEENGILVLSSEQKDKIRVTEFYPYPSTGGSEWVEIYNENEVEVSLENWYIDDILDGGSSAIQFSINIPTKSYYVLDLSRSILNNSSEDAISLLDESKNPIHIVNYTKAVEGYSIQKLSDGKWYLTLETTKGSENLTKQENLNPSENVSTSKEESTDSEFVNEEVQSSLSKDEKENVYITEFYPNPESGENEWIEIYNANKSEMFLENWYVDDVLEGGGSAKGLSINIKPEEYSVIEINTSLLNNSDDSVSLLDENKSTVHVVNYKKTTKGMSIQKLSNEEWYITSNITKGEGNLEYVDLKLEDAKLDLREEDSLDSESISETDSKDIIDNLLSNDIEEGGEVLGSSSAKLDLDYKTVPIYRMQKPFTVEREPRIYVITSNNEPNPWIVLVEYIEKAFW